MRWEHAGAHLQCHADAGHELFPLVACDRMDLDTRDRGKIPASWGWRSNSWEPEAMAKWMADGFNVGVKLTAEDIIIDVDIYNFAEGDDPLRRLVENTGLDLSVLPRVQTGSGGSHYYLRKSAETPTVSKLKGYKGLDFRSVGLYVVAGGSMHHTGNPYFLHPSSPPLTDAPQAPDRLISLLRRVTSEHTQDGGELSLDDLDFTLDQLDPKTFREEGKWMAFAMGVHHATNGAGGHALMEWSAKDPFYTEGAAQNWKRWNSFRVGAAGGKTIRTVFQHLLKAGGNLPKGYSEELFSSKPGIELEWAELDACNKRFAMCSFGGKTLIGTRRIEHSLGPKQVVWDWSNTKDFETFHDEFVHIGFTEDEDDDGNKVQKKKWAKRGAWWLEHQRKRKYESVYFHPTENYPKALNLFEGLGVDPAPGSWDRFKHLIFNVLVDQDAAAYEYVIRWMAHGLQRPDLRAEVALVLQGEQGTGKGFFGRAWVDIWGTHGMHVISANQLLGDFNDHLEKIIGLYADEAIWSGNHAHRNKLKGILTEPTAYYNRKFVPGRMGKTFLRVIFSSNDGWVVPAELGGRRFACFEVSNTFKENEKYFAALHKEMYQEGGIEAMAHDLLCLPLGNWHPRRDIPQTEALRWQRFQGLDELGKWWVQTLEDGVLPGVADWTTGDVHVVASKMQDDYYDACDRAKSRTRKSVETELGDRLGGYIPGWRRRNKPGKYGPVRRIVHAPGAKVDSKGRATVYELPSLAECRAAFDKAMGGPWGWIE